MFIILLTKGFPFRNSILNYLIILKLNIVNIYKYANYIIEIEVSIQFQFYSDSVPVIWF